MTKILFVCHGNVGRSQMAEGFYNFISKSDNATSAGVDPKTPEKYLQIPPNICELMAEKGIDISNNKVKLINKNDVEKADKIFVLCDKKLCPDFLNNSKKVAYWKIRDPYKVDINGIRKIRNIINKKVESILSP